MASKTANKRKEESREGALSVTRAEHYALKRRIRKFEKKNLRYIVLFPCSGDQDWYEMGDNSALLYKYVICEERGIKVKMASDAESFKEKFEIGIVKTRGTNRVKERIKQAGLYFKEMEEGGAITFILNKVFPEKELEELRKKELGRQEELKNIVRINVVDPVFYREMSELAIQLRSIATSGMSRFVLSTIGERIYLPGFEVLEIYTVMAKDEKNERKNREYWETIKDKLEALLIELQLIADQKIIDMEKCAKLGDKTKAVIKMTERHCLAA